MPPPPRLSIQPKHRADNRSARIAELVHLRNGMNPKDDKYAAEYARVTRMIAEMEGLLKTGKEDSPAMVRVEIYPNLCQKCRKELTQDDKIIVTTSN